jgi:hypothetical protein
LLSSGLYEELVPQRHAGSHEEVNQNRWSLSSAYKVIRPEVIGFISYPYEWSFSQLKDAALRTLAIQTRVLKKGMSLKDASAYNIQFHNGSATLIDTLSFEAYQEGQPWVAYKQFCQHFLAPLALMSHRDVRLSQLLRVYVDGIPLDLASRVLPARTRLNFGIEHAYPSSTLPSSASIPLQAWKLEEGSQDEPDLPGGIGGELEIRCARLKWEPAGTEWGRYYDESAAHYSEEASPAIKWRSLKIHQRGSSRAIGLGPGR